MGEHHLLSVPVGSLWASVIRPPLPGGTVEQRTKERAVHLALTRGMGLFTRGHQIWGVFPDGNLVVVCGGRHAAGVWDKALAVLLREAEIFREAPPRFRLVCPSGVFEADTMHGLIARWALGRARPLPPSDTTPTATEQPSAVTPDGAAR